MNTTNNISKVGLFIAFLFALLCNNTAWAEDPELIADGGASLNAITSLDWTMPQAINTGEYTAYYSNRSYCLVGGEFKVIKDSQDRRYAQAYNTLGVGFKLQANKTYVISVTYASANTEKDRGIHVLKYPTFSTSALQISYFPTTASFEPTVRTVIVSPTSDTTYWVSGSSAYWTALYSIKVEELSSLSTITENKKWYGASDVTIAANSLFSDNKFYNFGTDKAPNTTEKLYFEDANRPTYDFGNDYIIFKSKGRGRVILTYKEKAASTNLTSDGLTVNTGLTSAGNGILTFPATNSKAIGWEFSDNRKYSKINMTLSDVNVPVRIKIVYTDNTEDLATFNTETSREVKISPDRSLKYIFIETEEGTTGGSVTFDSATLTPAGTSATVLKAGDDYATASEVANHTSSTTTGVVTKTYPIDDDEDATYYISGGLLGAIEIKLDYDPTNLSPITEDFVWYALGTILYNNPLGGRLVINDIPLNAGTKALYINGNNTKSLNGSVNTNKVETTQALAFKLKAKTSYRIMIICDNQGIKTIDGTNTNLLLKKGNTLKTATYLTGNYGFNTAIIDNSGDTASNQYTVALDLTTGDNDEVYWIQPDSQLGDVNIGAIEVLPYSTSNDFPSDLSVFRNTAVWTIDQNKSQINETETGRNNGNYLKLDILKSGTKSNSVYVYGPSMLVHDYQKNALPATNKDGESLTAVNSSTVMLNRGNALAFKVVKGSKVTVNFWSPSASNADNKALALWSGDNYSSAKNSGYVAHTQLPTGEGQLTYTATNNETLWLSVNNATSAFVYISGIYVELPYALMEVIEDNYLFTASESDASSLSSGTVYSNYHFKYIGDGETTNSSTQLTVPSSAGSESTTTSNTYAFETDDHIGFKVVEGNKGKINVYYSVLTGTSEDLGLEMYSGAALYDFDTHVVSFGTAKDNNEDYGDYGIHMRGWYFGRVDDGARDLSDYNTVVVTFDATPVQLSLIAQDGTNTVSSQACPIGSTSITLDLNNGGLNKETVTQIYLYAYGDGDVTINSCKLYTTTPVYLSTGTDETDPTVGYDKMTTRLSKITYDSSNNTIKMTYPFNHLGNDSEVLYWVNGDMNLAAIEVVFDDPIDEPVDSRGANGYAYINQPVGTAFPYETRFGVNGPDTDESHIDLMNGTTKILSFMPGTTAVHVYRSASFLLGGGKWKSLTRGGNQGGYLDNVRAEFPFSHAGTGAFGTDYLVNGDPHTECNGGIGGFSTENGGMFLTPVAGDFFRYEPEYDGVVTMWILQNGNTDNDTGTTGYLTRRPCYVMDENGVIMQRSTIKPSFDYTANPSHYAINGTWVDINPESPIRTDYRDAWAAAKSKWNTEWSGTDGDRYKETMRFYAFWYDGGEYTFDYPGDNIDIDNWIVEEDSDGKLTTNTSTLTENQKIGLIVYNSDNLITALENNGIAQEQNKFAKYGYEVPTHIHVRYVFPVRAGKTYYMGGRGTKNGFMEVKFEPMPNNYDYKTFISQSYNYKVTDGPNKGKYILESLGSDGSNYPFNPSDIATNISGYSAIPVITIDEGSEFTWPTDLPEEGLTVRAKVKRNFKENTWHAIVLPFSVSETRMREMFGDSVKVLYLDPKAHTYGNKSDGMGGDWMSALRPAVRDQKLSFTRHYYQMLYANTPAFICPSQDVPTKYKDGDYVVFDRVHLDKTNIDNYEIGYIIGETDGYEYWVTGSYAPVLAGTSSNPHEMYYLDNLDGNAVIYHSSTGVALKGTRCWVEPRRKNTSPAPERAPLLMEVGFNTFDGADMQVNNSTSGIEDIVMEDMTIEMYDDDNVYDMLGRMVGYGSTDGLGKGVYIFKGKKVYVR